MAALRAVTRSSTKSSTLMPIRTVHVNGSFSIFNRSPTRATPPQLMQSPGPRPALSPKKNLFTVIEGYERGVIFRSGKHSGEKDPGLRWSCPVFNEVRKVDMRTRTMQIPSQELMTKDNVTIHVDAVAFFKVEDPLKALCNIEELTSNWGVAVLAVKLKNIRVDTTMIRAMGRVAEAERVREARVGRVRSLAEARASGAGIQRRAPEPLVAGDAEPRADRSGEERDDDDYTGECGRRGGEGVDDFESVFGEWAEAGEGRW